ncbi:MAG TPA: hypothetical protein DCF73_08895 [Rhodobiaceae bacterium]|nr:hypothetical protein [Rhodobiaceae bacterium]
MAETSARRCGSGRRSLRGAGADGAWPPGGSGRRLFRSRGAPPSRRRCAAFRRLCAGGRCLGARRRVQARDPRL